MSKNIIKNTKELLAIIIIAITVGIDMLFCLCTYSLMSITTAELYLTTDVGLGIILFGLLVILTTIILSTELMLFMINRKKAQN